MALSRSTGTYKNFVCLNSIHGGHGCRNKGNTLVRIIDEAILKAVSAQILDAAGPVGDVVIESRQAEAQKWPGPMTQRSAFGSSRIPTVG